MSDRSVGFRGEIVRTRHAVKRLQAHLFGLELALDDAEKTGIPPGNEPGQALVTTCYEIATGLAKIDALIRVEK